MTDRQAETQRPTAFLPAAADPSRRHSASNIPDEVAKMAADDQPVSPPISTRKKMQTCMSPSRAERPTGWLSGSGGRARRSWRAKNPEDLVDSSEQGRKVA
eukprot:CAMPEP_0198117534 /NCGR_PEP_ID=MMETSP1442-20131203/18463_1 /TAXON_ID= /ORGANISM="Craspedostauros australis, Strain CCMP3328" /LENGTH=100 /DNA_ID=CAMNT_0043775603 /DNA_START=273 /DNA_END=575 /DNA_ORIENTATION=+